MKINLIFRYFDAFVDVALEFLIIIAHGWSIIPKIKAIRLTGINTELKMKRFSFFA